LDINNLNSKKMNINKKIIIGLMLVVPLMFSTCTKDLADMNINPNTSQVMNYGAQFLYSQGYAHQIMGQIGMSFYGCAMQQLAAITLYQAPGDKYLNANDDLGSMYKGQSTNSIKNLVDLINRTKDDPELSNYTNIARIMKVYAFAILTDSWGDLPYSEAGKGYIDLNFKPKFDTQESIYADFFKELNEAIPALDASKKTYDGSDSYYSGDVQKWKKLGYSLMLRLAMRVQKVNPTLAQQWVNTAVSGGVLTSNDDNQVFHHSSSGVVNSINSSMRSNFARFRVSRTIVDMMRNADDPRLNIFFEPYSGTVLEGLPNGLDATTIADPIQNPSGIEFDESAYYNRTILADLSAPDLGITYAEVCLLKCEAVLRGWITGDATALYNAGVTASMQMWGIYTGITAPSDVAIQTYLTAHPFDGSYKMIGEQMYLTLWRQFGEVFSNWRRTGFPVFVAVQYPNNVTGGVIPRRIPYYGYGTTNIGVLTNWENYQAAVARQGTDNYLTRVWWDKE
jgi:hypothetical protein